MKSKKYVTLLILIMSFSILFQFNLSTNNIIESNGFKGSKPLIIFDVAHEQRFNHTHMQSAIELIENEFNATVHINYDPITLTSLRGADLVILMAPFYYTELSFTSTERRAMVEFYQDGGSVLYLANPFFFEDEMRNYSSNIVQLNNMMGDQYEPAEGTYGSLELFRSNTVLFNDFSYRYDDERYIYIDNNTLANDHEIIEGYNGAEPVKELLTYATYGSTIHAKAVINTSLTTYELNVDGEINQGSVFEHSILLADEKYNGRGISCGSAIMFSDMNITEDGALAWFEVYDNALLWKNIIAWLLLETPEVQADNPIANFGLFAISIFAVFFILLVVGSIFYTVGREAKRVEVSETIIKMRDRDDSRRKVDKEIEEAYYAEDEVYEEDVEEEEAVEEKEVDMKSISDELKKKPPKTRSRSERRRRR